jgi:hypothetical protein
MDGFAEPVIGRRFAPTRWLATTFSKKSPPSFTTAGLSSACSKFCAGHATQRLLGLMDGRGVRTP